MSDKSLISGSISLRIWKAIIIFILYAGIIYVFTGCGEEIVETETTGVTGTVLPSGIAATVRIMQNDAVLASTDVDSKGEYTILDLAEGEYSLVILAYDYIGTFQPIVVIEGQITEAGESELKKIQKIKDIGDPSAAVTITGKVTDLDNGEPIADALVLIHYEENGTGVFTYTEKNGSFAVGIDPALLCHVIVTKSGYEPLRIPAEDASTFEVSLGKVRIIGLDAGETAPDFTLPDLNGVEMSLKDFRGQVVLIDFWATWCGPCTIAIPHVQKLYEKYKSQGFVVLGVDVWERGEVEELVRDFQKDYGLTYDILLDKDGSVAELYEVKGIPSAWLLGSDGIITWTHLGFSAGGEVELEKQISAAL